MNFLYYCFIFVTFLSSSSESTKDNDISNKIDDHNEIKNKVEKWWKESSNQTRRKCKEEKLTLPKIPILESIKRIQIKSYSCPNNTKHETRYRFHGLDKSNYPEGKGKLKLILNSEWSKLSKDEKNKFNQLGICYEMIAGSQGEIKEIIGIFKNGSLHGPAKIVWTENSTVIANFKDGYLNGYQRTWNGNGDLVMAGYYKKGMEIGSYWKRVKDHLVFVNSEMLKFNHERISLIFPILANGLLGAPVAGSFHPHLDILEDAHDVLLTGIKSSPDECMLQIDYQRTTKKNSRYLLSDKIFMPFSFHENYPLCRNITESSLDKPDEQLLSFFNYVDSLIYGENIFANQTYFEGFKALWHLKPLSEELDQNRAIELISNIAYNDTTNTFSANILGSKRPLKIQFNDFKLNDKLEIDGYCDISIDLEDRYNIPKDVALDWPPYRIRGIFKDGKLNGISVVETNTQSFGWVTMKDNVIHGPVIFHALMPVNPVSFSFS